MGGKELKMLDKIVYLCTLVRNIGTSSCQEHPHELSSLRLPVHQSSERSLLELLLHAGDSRSVHLHQQIWPSGRGRNQRRLSSASHADASFAGNCRKSGGADGSCHAASS